jgi:hypothetical protein
VSAKLFQAKILFARGPWLFEVIHESKPGVVGSRVSLFGYDIPWSSNAFLDTTLSFSTEDKKGFACKKVLHKYLIMVVVIHNLLTQRFRSSKSAPIMLLNHPALQPSRPVILVLSALIAIVRMGNSDIQGLL